MIARVLTGVSVAGLAATAGCLAVIMAKNAEERSLRETLGGWEACAAQVRAVNPMGGETACPSEIAAADLAARRARRCDVGLAAGDRFAVDAACSQPVKRIAAEAAVRAQERDALQTQLNDLRDRQAAAIARAEARGRQQTQRTERAQSDLAAAPRTDDGLGRCDAECLRDLGRDPGAR